MIRFGLAGCGAIARAHIDSLQKIPGVRLTTVWNHRPDPAARLAEELGCAVAESLVDLVERDDVDAVTICTPSGYHMEPALAAIEAGKHVLVEKPLEVTEERCRRMIDAADRRGVKLGVIFQSRFVEANRAAREAVAEGRFGRLVMGSAYVKWHRPQAYYDSGSWRGTWKYDGGGALMNQAIHAVDLLLWLMGPVTTVYGHVDALAHDGIEVEDTAAAVLRFDNDAIGVIEASTSVYPGYPKRIEVHGDRGGVTLEDDAVADWREADTPERGEAMKREFGPKAASGAASDPMAISFEYHRRQIEDFIHAIQEDRDPLVDGEAGARAVAVVRAIYRSASEGRPVDLA